MSAETPARTRLSDAPALVGRPQSLGELFRVFTLLALQGFGGVLAVAQHELVERRRWVTREQFLEMLSVGQVLPGPNVCNLALMLGDRWFGWRGALVALGGLIAVPLVIVLALAVLYNGFAANPAVAGALRGMGVVAAGLVVATALRLAPTLRASRLGLPLALAFVALPLAGIAWLRWPLVWVVLGVGLPAIAVAWRRGS